MAATWYRLGRMVGVDPPTLGRMKLWQFFALLGRDLPPDPGTEDERATERVRAQMEARARQMRNLDPETRAERAERLGSRRRRRAAQRADPEWQAEVKAAKTHQGEGRPDLVADGEIIIHQVSAPR